MTVITKNNGERRLPFDEERLVAFIQKSARGRTNLPLDEYTRKIVTAISAKDEYKAEQITQLLITSALANIDMGFPDWTYVAAHVHMTQLYKKAAKKRVYDADEQYGDFYSLITSHTDSGVYSSWLLESYSKEEIQELGEIIVPERDLLFTYIGLKTLSDRYLATTKAKEVFELPQERFLVIAMHLMSKEPADKRIDLVKESYWALSNLYMTVATPTLTNAGRAYGQLSSCFIDTVDDSLRGIFDSNTDVATLSKGGGGIGVYMGKVRSRGSDIRGFLGASSGVIPWIKQLNNTAVSVDQLGQRQGAIAVYLDIWHKDIQPFLDLRLNNGDERLRAHDIFTGVCLPDIFMETVDKRGMWYLFDPHEVRTIMGYGLEDFYDEKKGSGSFRDKYLECVADERLSKDVIPAIDIMKRIMRSQLETGVPFMYYRDEANRMNPNKHEGMIYSSNLCTEIFQNTSATVTEEIKLDGDKIITQKSPGDFVVCNLSSINLGKAVPADVLERLIAIQVRMLDNVIDLNDIEVPQAQRTNKRYRAVGLGTFGWHHLLAVSGVHWESDEAVELADSLYEKIAFLTIQASMELAKEKGAYPLFEGSDWQTGEYFEKRGYLTDDDTDGRLGWESLMHSVAEYGIRNGNLMAVAPNMSTATLAGSTASIDPIFQVEYSEEKNDYKIPVTVPEISYKTFPYYRSAYLMDQKWTLKQNAARQRHIDQGQSCNIYVQNTVKAGDLLALHLFAWSSGHKSTYYVRSTSVEVLECEWCAS